MPCSFYRLRAALHLLPFTCNLAIFARKALLTQEEISLILIKNHYHPDEVQIRRVVRFLIATNNNTIIITTTTSTISNTITNLITTSTITTTN